MTEFIEAVPAPAAGVGTGGLYAAPLPPSTAGPWLIPTTRWVTPALHVPRCKKAQPVIGAAGGCHTRMMPLFWLCWRRV